MFPLLIIVELISELSIEIGSVPKNGFPNSSVLKYSRNFLRLLLLIGPYST